MKTVVLLSGGMDSAVLAYHLKSHGHEIKALSVDYGQRHRRELRSARTIADTLGLEPGEGHKLLGMGPLCELLAGSSQTSGKVHVPEGHYTDESMKVTVVPNRNMLLLSLAGAWAVSLKYDGVAYAAHSGDHAIYPDCRPEFTEAMEDALRLCDWHPIKLLRPFLYPSPQTKADIVSLGTRLGVPFELTWSCYKGQDVHCGKCGTCVERREAFTLSGINDPTEYQKE